MNSHEDDGSIPGLPTAYPLDDPALSHHHDHHIHDHNHDLEHDASLAAEFFAATENAGDLSLHGAGGLSRDVDDLPSLHQEHEVVHPPPAKSRKRKLQLACHFCRRRKLKCDGSRPTCDNCEKRQETCEWDDSVRRRGPGKRTKALRERAADEAAGAGLHEATGMGSKHLDPNAYNVDTASSVADTNAALIAAVTAAAAEGAGGMDDAFGPGDISASGGTEYGGHHDEEEDVGDLSGLQDAASVTDSQHHGLDPLDPNIDPSLAEIAPSTLADASSPTIPTPHQHTLTQLEQQQLQAALQLQRQEHLLQQQQQQRKLGGVGVGVSSSVHVQAPNFGVIQTPHGFGLAHLGGGPSGEVDSSSADVGGGIGDADVNGADALDWDKGYNFSAWPDLDLGGTTH